MASFAATETPKTEETSVSTATAATTAVESHVCATPGCGKLAHMACPTCIKLGIPPSRFCGQECFKSSWEEHKKVHADVRKTRAVAKVDPSQMPTEFK
eukprot:gene25383-32598_t